MQGDTGTRCPVNNFQHTQNGKDKSDCRDNDTGCSIVFRLNLMD